MKILKKLMVITIGVSIILSLAGCGKDATIYTTPDINTIGNTHGNITNSGFVCIQGRWIYYANTSKDNMLYRISDDDEVKEKICDDSVWFINVVDEWIYYRNNEDASLYRIKNDGTERELLYEGDVIDVNVLDGKIYFTDEDKNFNLFSCNYDGSELITISEYSVWYANVVDEWIYYVERDDSDLDFIYKMKIDGTNRTRINKNRSRMPVVDGDYIYYINRSDDDKIFRIKTDGTEDEMLVDSNCWNINIYNGKIYYIDLLQKLSDNLILSYNIETSEVKKIAQGQYFYINMANNNIYTRDIDSLKISRIDMDGEITNIK